MPPPRPLPYCQAPQFDRRAKWVRFEILQPGSEMLPAPGEVHTPLYHPESTASPSATPAPVSAASIWVRSEILSPNRPRTALPAQKQLSRNWVRFEILPPPAAVPWTSPPWANLPAAGYRPPDFLSRGKPSRRRLPAPPTSPAPANLPAPGHPQPRPTCRPPARPSPNQRVILLTSPRNLFPLREYSIT
jgi:hypothetical protein